MIGKEIRDLLGKLGKNDTVIKEFINFKPSELSYISGLFDKFEEPDTDETFDELQDFSKISEGKENLK